MPNFERVNSMGTVAKPTGPVGVGVEGDELDRPTDVGWDKQGNIFIADGHVNSRIAKFDSNGRFVKSWGSQGTAPGQFNVPHSLVTDAQGNVTWPIGTTGAFRCSTTAAHSRRSSSTSERRGRCASRRDRTMYLYISNSNDPREFDMDGEIYKMEFDGRIVRGWLGRRWPGRQRVQHGARDRLQERE